MLSYPIDLSRRSSTCWVVAESDLWGRSSKSEAPSLKNEDGNLPLKKSSRRHTGELCPNLPKCPIPTQKIDIDNNTRFRYQVGYWFPLIDASICGVAAEADTQSNIFDSSASKKQYLIFLSFGPNFYRTSYITTIDSHQTFLQNYPQILCFIEHFCYKRGLFLKQRTGMLEYHRSAEGGLEHWNIGSTIEIVTLNTLRRLATSY